MVKPVQAFEASDGKVFTTQLEALEHETQQRLKQLETFTVPTAAAIVSDALNVYEIISPLVSFLHAQQGKPDAREKIVAELQSESR